MPRIQEASGGGYGTFLFATYAVVLGFAAFATLRSEAPKVASKLPVKVNLLWAESPLVIALDSPTGGTSIRSN
jgi:hypothetical protein